MVIKEEILDQMIDDIESLKPLEVNDMTIRIGEYKGYDVRVVLHKPEEEK